MTNFDTAREALETSLNSSGSALQEHEKWQKSLEAQILKLKASWQGLSQAFLSSDFLHGALDAVIGLVDGLTELIDTFGAFPTLMGTVAAGFSLFKNQGFATFDKQSKSIQLLGNNIMELGGSFKKISTAVNTYNSNLSKSTGLQNAYVNAVNNQNSSLGAYLSGLNGAKASFSGYIKYLFSAKAATIGLSIASTALNAALTMGLSFAIQLVVEGIQKLINADKELAESVEEITSKFKQEHDELKKLQGDYDASNESSMISKYEKLSKGVDNLGRNVSLTSEEYSEYQSIVNQIAEQIPSLVTGYDAQGNALLSCKGNVEELTAAYEKLIHVQNQEILSNASDIEKNWENVLSQANGYDFWEAWGNNWSLDGFFGGGMDDFDMKTDTAKWLGGLTSDTSSKEINDYFDSFINPEDLGTHIRKRKEIIQALQKADYDVGFWTSQSKLSEVLADALKNEPHKIKGILDNYYAQFDEDVAKYKTKATALLSEAFDISSAISGLDYNNISEELQNIARQTVNGLDFEFLSELSESGKTIEQWTTEMLDQLNAINQEDSASISAAFDLQTQFNGGEIPYGEYVNGLEDTGKLIEKLNLKPEIESQLKLSLGLDEKGLVAGYKQLRNRLADQAFDIASDDYVPFIESLSSEELSVLWKIIPELEETDYKETIEDVKNALRREMIVQGLTFDLNLEVESAGIEALNTALAESVSATGLSSESIAALKGRYSELESQGYDLSSMFEETSNGIHVNRNELNKLEKVYASQKLDEVNSDLAEMKAEYDRIGEELKTCSDEAKAGLYNDQLTLAQKISEAATLASQYEGLTSAYNDWIKAEEAGQERDMYENIIEGFENIDDEISRGWIDDGAIEFLELLTGRTDLAGKSGKQLKEIYDGLDKTIGKSGYSIRDFFTVNEDGDSTNTGVYNFLETVESFEDKLGDVIKRKDGNIVGFDFEVAGGDEVIAETLGISKELVQIMLRAADDAGFVISLDGTYRQLADLQNEAKTAANYLKEIGKTDFEFDFNTSNVESLNTQLNEAHKILDDPSFWKDGVFDDTADGAKQAMEVVSTLRAKLDYLTQDKYGIGLTVEDEEFEEPLTNLQEYGRTIQTLNQLKLNPKVNAEEIEECETRLDELAQEFNELDTEKKLEIGLEIEKGMALTQENLDKLTDEKKIKLGFVDDDGKPLTNVVDVIQNKIESGEVTIPTVLDIQANMDKNIEKLADLAWLNSGFLTDDEEEIIRKKYNIKIEGGDVDDSDVEEKVEGVVVDGLGNPILSRTANIAVIAETFGIEDIDILTYKLKGLDDKTVQAIAEAIGKRDVEALDIAVAGMDGNEVDAVCNTLGYSNLEELKTAIRNMQGNEVDAKVNTDGQAEKVWSLQRIIDGIKGKTVDVVVNVVEKVKSAVSNAASAGAKAVKKRFGIGGVNGTANVNGTTGQAFKQGSWGTKNSGTALVGELGRETLVRGGRYYTIGNDGAEFIKYQRGDIIFNHRQTEELFKNGRVTSGGGRGKALVGGTAFVSGTAFEYGSSGTGGGVKIESDSVVVNSKSTKSSDSNNSSGSSGTGGGVKAKGTSAKKKADTESTSSSSSEKNNFEETIDFVEIAISRIEREIDNLDKKVGNVYKSWSDRNSALSKEINKVGDEIALQQSAAQEYLKKANQVGLSESYAKKIRDGSLNIEDFKGESNEKLVEKIKDYQTWYEKALDCKDAILELKETEASLYAQRFENVQSQYDGILQGYEHTESMLNEYISQAEAKGQIVGRTYYDALIANERQNINVLKMEQAALIKARDEAVASGKIAKYSEEWVNMSNDIDSVTQAIEEGATSIIEYNNAIRDIEWETFDLIQQRISDVTEEADFLIELMSNKDLYDDNGKLTSQGLATMGLHGQNYNTYMYQADLAGAEAAKLKQQLEANPDDVTNLEEQYRKRIAEQREYILAAEDAKNAIVDLVENGIELELDALQEKIDLYNEALESQKDLYDYQKRVEEQTKNIASLQKQLSAYEGDNSEEAKAKIQELKVSLEEAEADLEETQYDKYISDQSALLDNLYLEYETILNERMDNTDALISEMIAEINADASVIGDTITQSANDVGYTLSQEMESIWNSSTASINGVITTYGDQFSRIQTTTNTFLGNIKASVNSLVSAANKEAEKKANEPKTQPASKSDSVKNADNTNANKNNGDANKSDGDGVAKVGDKVKFVSGQYYYDSYGTKPLGSQELGNYVYITYVNEKGSHPYHVSRDKNNKHPLGWLKKSQISGYATGKKNFFNDEIAWTQENGQEFIVRPSDGAILTPVAKGDSVLTSAATNNIWQMANNPAEFIKDNLNLGATDVPNNSTVQNSVVQNFEKVVFSMPNIRNYDELIRDMQRDPNFERLVESMTIGKIAGKSSLAKGKAIR